MKYLLLAALIFAIALPLAAQNDDGPTFEEMYELGLKSFQNKNYEQAVIYLNKALAKKPDDYDSYNYRAQSFYALHLHNPADADVEKMLQLKPTEFGILRLQAEYYFVTDNFKKAIEAYNRLIFNGQRKAEYFMARGLAKQNLDDYFNSIADFDTTLLLKPDFDLAQYYKSISYKHLELPEKALIEINKYIERKPADNKGYYQRGYLHFSLGEGDKAIADFTTCIKLDTTDLDAYVNRGAVYQRMKKTDSAIADYNRALKVNNRAMEVYFHRAGAYKEAGRFNEAFDDYNKTIELRPDFSLAYLNRGVLYYEQAQYNLAIDDFNMALALNYREANVYFNKGLCLLKLEDYKNAEANFNRALELDKSYAPAYLNRGIARVKQGSKDDWCSDFYTANNMGVKDAKEYIAVFCDK